MRKTSECVQGPLKKMDGIGLIAEPSITDVEQFKTYKQNFCKILSNGMFYRSQFLPQMPFWKINISLLFSPFASEVLGVSQFLYACL